MKHKGVIKIFEWLNREIKMAKANYSYAKKQKEEFGMYDEHHYNENLRVAEAKLNQLDKIKVSTRKFAKSRLMKKTIVNF